MKGTCDEVLWNSFKRRGISIHMNYLVFAHSATDFRFYLLDLGIEEVQAR